MTRFQKRTGSNIKRKGKVEESQQELKAQKKKMRKMMNVGGETEKQAEIEKEDGKRCC